MYVNYLKKYVYDQIGGLDKSPLNDVVLNSPIYNDEDEWEKDNYTPARIIRLVATLTGGLCIISAGCSNNLQFKTFNVDI